MRSFGEILKFEMDRKGINQAELCRRSGLKSGHVSPYLNEKADRDPRLSTASKIAEALDVSLDYLAGRTDNPLGMCEEELEGLHIDAEARRLLKGFELLPPDGKRSVNEQVELQLLKSGQEANVSRSKRRKAESVA